jgi:transcriptional regulator with XRE-family HTH domain
VSKNTRRELICLKIVESLKEERVRQGLSMQRLAAKAGLSTSMVSLVERDMRNPTLDTLLRIAEVLEFDLGSAIQKAQNETVKAKP